MFKLVGAVLMIVVVMIGRRGGSPPLARGRIRWSVAAYPADDGLNKRSESSALRHIE